MVDTMALKHEELLGCHPEIDHFYRDVAGLKRGGKRGKKSKAKAKAKAKATQHLENRISIRIGQEKSDPFQPHRAQSQMATFASPPHVTQPSYFAVAPGVGMWRGHSQPAGVDTAHPGHYQKTVQVNDPSSQIIQTQANPNGIKQGADRHDKRVIPTPADCTSGNMVNNPIDIAMRDMANKTNSLANRIAEYEHQRSLTMDADGLQPHVSQNYFAPTGAPGNHPAPRAAQAAPRPSSYYPMRGQIALSREEQEHREQEKDVEPHMDWSSSASPVFPPFKPTTKREEAEERRLINEVHRSIKNISKHGPPGSEEEQYARLKHGGRYHAHSVFN